MSGWLWGTNPFDDAVEKATSELRPSGEEDLILNLEICDQIKAKQVPAKEAMRSLKRRLDHKNPNSQLLALSLTDTCVKNGGDHFLAEIASREFMDNLSSVLKIPTLNRDVKERILRYIQNWAIALESKPQFSYINTVYKGLQKEGFEFPPKDMTLAAGAMTDTAIAPEWIDSDVCLRCRDAFTFTNRKHHCRNCGRVYDQKCSSKMLPLPHFGITQAVRVCDACDQLLGKRKEEADEREAQAAKKIASKRVHFAPPSSDADLQRAIELSLREADQSRSPGYVPAQPAQPVKQWRPSEPPMFDSAQHDEDAELRLAIEASLREAEAPRPSAPTEEPTYLPNAAMLPSVPTFDLLPKEADAIITFSQTVADAQTTGRPPDTYRVRELYNEANNYQPKLAHSLDDAGRKEQLLSEMNDKMSQAVKLYDHLLTEQLSQSSWRRSTPAPANHYQQVVQSQPWQHAPSTPLSYNPSVAPPASWAHSSPRQAEPSYVPAPPVATPSFQYSSAPPTTSDPILPPVTIAARFQPQSYQTPQPATPITAPPPPVFAPPAPSLSRHNSVAYSASPRPAVNPSHLHRASTISTSHPHHRTQIVAPPPPTAIPQPVMPVLPTVPTNAPQTYSLLGAHVPTTTPVLREEPKEAVLIEL